MRRFRTLLAYRRALNLSQAAAARRVPMAQGAWCRIERGEEVPRPGLAMRLEAVTGVPLDSFIRSYASRARQEAPRGEKLPAVAAAPIGRLLLKPGDVALALSVGKTKVYELIASGALPSVRLPSRSATATRQDVRVRRRDLEAWIDNCERVGGKRQCC